MNSKFITLSGALLSLCLAVRVYAADDQHNHGEDQDHGHGEEVSAHDYIGVYMEIPEEIQHMIGLKTVAAEPSPVKAKVHLNGRIPQDVEDITEVYAPLRGILSHCPVALGMRVQKGQTLCVIKAEEGQPESVITAPVAGIVIAEFSRSGEPVDTVTPIRTIADYSRIPVNFDVYEKDVGKIALGQKVLVYSSAYPEETFHGEITFVSPRIDETSFTLKIRARVANPDFLLKPGMFVRGEAILASRKEHVTVPSYSVQNLDGVHVVFLKDEDESFVPVEVRVAYRDKERTIIGGEVYAGDHVVVDGAYNIKSKIMEKEITGGCTHGH
ncbi:MAG: efflux RND transporter periplasmic adaptor subunit [Candidatus Omnitrophica bacterium]|nr:efflux RND transporter periplasmic adaptor subunit [Candidatus Omnitrophota bacterium]MCB9721909.1 efflux RND transporter periplasmic adaptor subunit [Candidatus Omnitrophota bacterium]